MHFSSNPFFFTLILYLWFHLECPLLSFLPYEIPLIHTQFKCYFLCEDFKMPSRESVCHGVCVPIVLYIYHILAIVWLEAKHIQIRFSLYVMTTPANKSKVEHRKLNCSHIILFEVAGRRMDCCHSLV